MPKIDDTMTSVPPVPSGRTVRSPVLRLVPTMIVPSAAVPFSRVRVPLVTVSEVARMPVWSMVWP